MKKRFIISLVLILLIIITMCGCGKKTTDKGVVAPKTNNNTIAPEILDESFISQLAPAQMVVYKYVIKSWDDDKTYSKLRKIEDMYPNGYNVPSELSDKNYKLNESATGKLIGDTYGSFLDLNDAYGHQASNFMGYYRKWYETSNYIEKMSGGKQPEKCILSDMGIGKPDLYNGETYAISYYAVVTVTYKNGTKEDWQVTYNNPAFVEKIEGKYMMVKAPLEWDVQSAGVTRN